MTNPPYSYRPGIGDKFVGQALRITRLTGGKVAMLLNLGCLAHPLRTSKWLADPPASIHIMDELVCWPNGDRRQAGRYITEHRYCWIVWMHEPLDRPRSLGSAWRTSGKEAAHEHRSRRMGTCLPEMRQR